MKTVTLILLAALLLAASACAPSRKSCRKNYPCPPPKVIERVEVRDSIIRLKGDTTTRTVLIPGPVVEDTRILWKSPQIQAEDNECARVYVQRIDTARYVVKTECKPREVKTETVERIKVVRVPTPPELIDQTLWDRIKEALGPLLVGFVIGVLSALFVRK